jgi:hypothetical protein
MLDELWGVWRYGADSSVPHKVKTAASGYSIVAYLDGEVPGVGRRGGEVSDRLQ